MTYFSAFCAVIFWQCQSTWLLYVELWWVSYWKGFSCLSQLSLSFEGCKVRRCIGFKSQCWSDCMSVWCCSYELFSGPEVFVRLASRWNSLMMMMMMIWQTRYRIQRMLLTNAVSVVYCVSLLCTCCHEHINNAEVRRLSRCLPASQLVRPRCVSAVVWREFLWPRPCSVIYGAWRAEGLEAVKRKAKVDLATHCWVWPAVCQYRTLFCLQMCTRLYSMELIVETAVLLPGACSWWRRRYHSCSQRMMTFYLLIFMSFYVPKHATYSTANMLTQ